MIRRDLRQMLNTNTTSQPKLEQKVLEDSDFEKAPPLASVLAAKVEKRVVHNRVDFVEVDDTAWKDVHNGVLLTIRQVCRMFDVTTMTVYHWVNKLGLPKILLGGGRNPPARYDEGQLKAWAEAMGKAICHEDYLEYR